MKKDILPFTKALLLIFTLALFFTSCKKEKEHKISFKATTKTWYRVSPTLPTPLIVNGKTYIGFAHFPGGGTGHATHMGDVTTYFNQLTYSDALDALPAGSVAAPVTAILGYPILGLPLPLIQPGDFTELASAISALNIPANVFDKIVNSVIYNGKGDAVFISAITGSGGTFPISKSLVGFNGKAKIVGGRGKFSHVAGELNYNGYFNITDPNDAAYNAEGWIAY